MTENKEVNCRKDDICSATKNCVTILQIFEVLFGKAYSTQGFFIWAVAVHVEGLDA